MRSKMWLIYALTTMVFFGVWGALIEIPEKAGFPAELGYVVWAIVMIIPAIITLTINNWELDTNIRAIIFGLIPGFLGAGGQLLLFKALVTGPAYLVFPFVSLSPVVAIILSFVFLKERVSKIGWAGIILAVIALPLLSYQSPEDKEGSGYLFIILALIVLFAWGTQQFFTKKANQYMKGHSLFVYLTIASLLLCPIALYMTDFSKEINLGFQGPYLAAMIQILNAFGALSMIFAFRYGKAMIVSPLMYVGAPFITIIISLALYAVIPHLIVLTGMILAIIAVFLLSKSGA